MLRWTKLIVFGIWIKYYENKLADKIHPMSKFKLTKDISYKKTTLFIIHTSRAIHDITSVMT